jgi:hypothetical protein
MQEELRAHKIVFGLVAMWLVIFFNQRVFPESPSLCGEVGSGDHSCPVDSSHFGTWLYRSR